MSDTSPIRALACVHRLDLLGRLFQTVYIPPAVASELRSPRGKLPAIEVRQITAVEVRMAGKHRLQRDLADLLDPGECEAIDLALDMNIPAILIDEALGRRVAEEVGLVPLGVLRLLVMGKAAGHIDQVAPLLQRLKSEANFFIHAAVERDILKLAGET